MRGRELCGSFTKTVWSCAASCRLLATPREVRYMQSDYDEWTRRVACAGTELTRVELQGCFGNSPDTL